MLDFNDSYRVKEHHGLHRGCQNPVIAVRCLNVMSRLISPGVFSLRIVTM